MKNFLENQQFYYVNDKLDLSKLSFDIDHMTVGFMNRAIERIGIDVNSSLTFMEESYDDIELSLSKWHISYIAKIDNIQNANEFIMMLNISPSDYGYYAISEVDFDLSDNISYSKTDKGFVLSSKDELFMGTK